MDKILAVFPAIKLPNEIHKLILTEQKFTSIFIEKIQRKLSSSIMALFGSIIFPFEIASILAGIENNIKNINDK